MDLGYFQFSQVNQEGRSLVSVIIPCYNHAHYLTEAVESIVHQTYSCWECIIVNDGSPDNTADVAKALIAKHVDKKIVLLEKENGGLADARNFGIRNSTGNYILPLDADDAIHPEMLSRTVSLLETHPDIGFAYTDTIRFGLSQNQYQTSDYDFYSLCWGNYINYCSLYRREAWEASGGYNTNMIYGYEDWDFWLACGEKGFFGKRIPGHLFMYRVKDKSMFTKALEHDLELKAQIVLNHPLLYERRARDWARSIITRRNDEKKHQQKCYRKILFVAPSFSADSINTYEAYVRDLAKELCTHGYDIHITYPDMNSETHRCCIISDKYQGLELHKITVPAAFSDLTMQIENRNVETNFKDLLVKQQIDIIHFFNVLGFPFSLLNTAKDMGLPLCLTLHDYWFICPGQYLYIQALNQLCSGPSSVDKCVRCIEFTLPNPLTAGQKDFLTNFIKHRHEYIKVLLQRIDFISSTSTYIANKFTANNFAANKISTTQPGISFIPPLVPKKERISQKVTFGYFHSDYDDLFFVVNAFLMIQGQAKLLICGYVDPSQLSQLKAFSLNNNRIEYKSGYCWAETPCLFASIDIIISPSIAENYFLVLSALDQKVPVIAPKIGELSDIIVHLKNGILFEPNNHRDLTRCMQEVVDNRILIERLKSGIKPIKSINKDADTWSTIYSNYLTSKTTKPFNSFSSH